VTAGRGSGLASGWHPNKATADRYWQQAFHGIPAAAQLSNTDRNRIAVCFHREQVRVRAVASNASISMPSPC